MPFTKSYPPAPSAPSAFASEYDSQGNDITELIKTFRIGAAKLRRDHLKVVIGAVVEASATVSGVEAAQRFGLYYREMGLLFEKTGSESEPITYSVYEVLCSEPNLTDSAILHEIRRNSDAGFQFFSGAQVVGCYHPSATPQRGCFYQATL